ETQVHREPQALPHRERARHARDGQQHEAAGHDAGEYAVAHHLAERVPRHQQGAHPDLRVPSAWNAELSAAAMNSSSSDGRSGVTLWTATFSDPSHARTSWT